MSKSKKLTFTNLISWAMKQEGVDEIIQMIKEEEYPDNVEDMLIRFAGNKQIMLECIVRQAEIMERMYLMYDELEELRNQAKDDRRGFLNTSDSIQ